MHKTISIFAAAFTLASLTLNPAFARPVPGATVSAGTDGVGADAFLKLNPLLVARGGFRYADFSISREFDGIDYDTDIGFTSGVAALDVHPFANGFRLSGGLYIGGRNIDLDASPARPVEIGEQVFTPEQIGVLTGRSEWNSAAPFAGIGFNNGANSLKRFGFQGMLGVMYMGEPDVTLNASDGLLSNDPLFLQQLAEEEEQLTDDLDDIQFYPILNLGFSLRF